MSLYCGQCKGEWNRVENYLLKPLLALGSDNGVAKRLEHVGGVLGVDVASGVVVAGAHVSGHAGGHGAGLAVLDGAAHLLGTGPDNLGVVAPALEVGHVGLAAIRVGVELELVVVPVVADGLGEELLNRQVLDVSSGVHGDVLAVRGELGVDADGAVRFD